MLHVLNNVVLTIVIEMVEILDRRVGKSSVEQVRYVIHNLLHLVIVKYGVCISTRLWLVTILTLLMKQLVLFHADPCNKYYILHWGGGGGGGGGSCPKANGLYTPEKLPACPCTCN